MQGGGKGREIGRDNEKFGGVEADRGVVLAGKAHAGGGELVSRRNNEVEKDEIQSRLTKECPAVPWQAQELGPEKEGMCSEIMHASTDLGGLRSRLERLTRKVGECG